MYQLSLILLTMWTTTAAGSDLWRIGELEMEAWRDVGVPEFGEGRSHLRELDERLRDEVSCLENSEGSLVKAFQLWTGAKMGVGQCNIRKDCI